MSMSSSRKKRRISSSDESDNKDKTEHDIDSPSRNGRSSSRIRDKKKKVFQKPTRDDIWDKIPSSTEKDLSLISPTKKVNNYLRVHSRYNADTYDIFNDDFLNDEEEIDYYTSSSICTDSEEQERMDKKKTKIKNRRKRLQFKSSSSSSSSDDKTHNKGTPNGDNSNEIKKKGSNPDSVKGDDLVLLQDNKDSKGDHSINIMDQQCVNNQNNDSESEEDSQLQCVRKTKQAYILRSDSESDNKNNESNSDGEMNEDGHLSRSERQVSKKSNLFRNFKESQARNKEKQRVVIKKACNKTRRST